jgi:hypothetical protein
VATAGVVFASVHGSILAARVEMHKREKPRDFLIVS